MIILVWEFKFTILVTDLQIQFQIGHINFIHWFQTFRLCEVWIWQSVHFFFTKCLYTMVHLTISLQPCTNRTACEKKACMTMLIETTSILMVGTIWHAATFLVGEGIWTATLNCVY